MERPFDGRGLASLREERVRAVVIGVRTEAAARFAPADALSFCALLSDAGCARGDVHLLLSPCRDPAIGCRLATRAHMVAALRDAAGACGGGDTLLVFYAGVSCCTGEPPTLYLFPCDGRREELTSLVSLLELRDIARDSAASARYLFVDA